MKRDFLSINNVTPTGILTPLLTSLFSQELGSVLRNCQGEGWEVTRRGRTLLIQPWTRRRLGERQGLGSGRDAEDVNGPSW